MRRPSYHRTWSGLLALVAIATSRGDLQALEVLASWQNFGVTANQTTFSTVQGVEPVGKDYFSDLSMTFQGMVGSNTANGTSPSFDTLSNTTNGNPSAAGQYIQLNFTKNPAFSGYTFTIENIIVRFWNNVSGQGEVHFYSSIGGFVGGTNGSPQMSSTNTGIFMTAQGTAPTNPQNFPSNAQTPGTMRNNAFSAPGSYQIRMAPDQMQGPDPHWNMASFNSFTLGQDTFNFPSNTVIGILGTVTVPEPSTYALSGLAVGAIAIIAKRRKRSVQVAKAIGSYPLSQDRDV